MKYALSLTTILIGTSVFSSQAAVMIDNFNAIVIDFAGFTGDGFASAPSAGQLDSDNWKVQGFSDGDLSFGGTGTTGDFARGLNDGGTGTGGFFAWDINGDQSVIAAGWQPGGSDVTPGNLTLQLQNNTGATLSGLTVSFDRWVNNDQDRSNSFDFGFSLSDPAADDDTGTVLNNFTSIAVGDSNGFVKTSSGNIFINQAIVNNQSIYLIWSGDDVSGSGSRDEFGISNISITAVPEPHEYAMVAGLALLGFAAFRRRRSRAAC